MISVITIAFSMLIVYWLITFFQKPAAKRPCTVMDDLTFKKIIAIYPINRHRPVATMKEWNVAVTTAEPEERFADHAGWMLYILIEHTNTIRMIALIEHIEMEESVCYYKACGSINGSVIKQNTLKSHEAK